MKGSISQVGDNRWRLRVFLYTDDNGRPVQRSRNFRGTKRQADTALAKFVTELQDGPLKPRSELTVAELIDRWMDQMVRPRRAKYTTVDYDRKIDKHIRKTLGAVRLDKLTAMRLDEAYNQWEAAGLAPATVRKLHAI